MSSGKGRGNNVGYGQPPTSGQFQKGTSGNPKGRPKKDARSISDRQIRSDIIEVLEEEVTVTQNGKKKKIAKGKAIMQQLTNKALKGEFRAIKLSLDVYTNAVAKHQELHPDLYKLLESLEKDVLSRGPEILTPADREFLNYLRLKTKPK
jgi:hypothetical protein